MADNLNDDDFSRINKDEDADMSRSSDPNMGANSGGDEFLTDEERLMIEGESTEVKNMHSGQGPLDNPIIQRSYTDRQFAGDTTSPISEPSEARQVINSNPAPSGPTVTPPTAQEVHRKADQENYKDRSYAGDTLGEKEVPRTGGNPATQTMTTKERKDNLEMTVTTAIEGYAKAKEWIGSWLTISDSSLIKREKDGKTPPDWAVLYDSSNGQVMTLRQFIAEGNKRIELACKTDEAFKAKVKPILMAELDRRNWIISPKQNGFIMFGADLLSMGQKLFTLHMNMRKVINQTDKEFELFNKTGYITARQQYNLERNFLATPPPPINYGSQQQNTTAPAPTPPSQTNATPTAEPHVKANTETEMIVLPKEEEEIEFAPPAE